MPTIPLQAESCGKGAIPKVKAGLTRHLGNHFTPQMCLKYWPRFSGPTTCTDATLTPGSAVPCSFLRTESLTVGAELRVRTSTLLSRPYGRTAFGGALDSGICSSPALGSAACLMQMAGSGLQPPACRAPETGTSREKTHCHTGFPVAEYHSQGCTVLRRSLN